MVLRTDPSAWRVVDLMHDQMDETLNAYGQRIIPALSN